MFVHESDARTVQMLPGFCRQTLAIGRQLMLVLFRMREGAKLPEHHHPHEQMGFVIDGDVELTVEGTQHRTPRGCCYLPYGNQRHSAVVLADSLVIDAFCPPREDYRPELQLPPAPSAGSPETEGCARHAGRPNMLLASHARSESPIPGVVVRHLLQGDRLAMTLLDIAAGSEFCMPAQGLEHGGFVAAGDVEVTLDGRFERSGTGLSFVAQAGGSVRFRTFAATRIVCCRALDPLAPTGGSRSQ